MIIIYMNIYELDQREVFLRLEYYVGVIREG